MTLIPAYKSDAVIVHAAQSALQQDYPQELHEVVVIADRLQPATLAELRRMPIRVLEASFENSSKARALNFAVGKSARTARRPWRYSTPTTWRAGSSSPA